MHILVHGQYIKNDTSYLGFLSKESASRRIDDERREHCLLRWLLPFLCDVTHYCCTTVRKEPKVAGGIRQFPGRALADTCNAYLCFTHSIMFYPCRSRDVFYVKTESSLENVLMKTLRSSSR